LKKATDDEYRQTRKPKAVAASLAAVDHQSMRKPRSCIPKQPTPFDCKS
jgi:hypothetical protein